MRKSWAPLTALDYMLLRGDKPAQCFPSYNKAFCSLSVYQAVYNLQIKAQKSITQLTSPKTGWQICLSLPISAKYLY